MPAELVSINFRNVPIEYRERLNRGASMRGWTIAEYMCHLIDLHDAMRSLADTMGGQVETELEALGLQTVRG